jgi:hypothetical protein
MGTPRFMHALLFASTFAAAAVFAANPIDEIATADGLTKINVKGYDLAYVRKGESLAPYTKVIVDPVEVAFHKNWNPERPGSRIKISSAERENIRGGVAKIVQEEFEAAMKGGYQLTREAAPDALRVKAKVLNLIANAPDTKQAGVYTVTMSAGEMTLLLELYDSETGAILARAVDRREGRNTGQWQVSSSVMGAGEAKAVAARWAKILRDGMDKAHAASSTGAPKPDAAKADKAKK